MNAKVCQRHGNEHEAEFRSGCWECDMEADIQARDRAEDEAVARYKMNRDAR